MLKKGLLCSMALMCWVAASFAAAEATKEADGPNIYGHLHVSVESIGTGAMTSEYVSSNSSRVGVKGEKPLDDNLTAIYQVEVRYNVDTAATPSNWLRNSFGGLTSPWGTVRAGHFDTPFKRAGTKHALFRDRIGNFRNIMGTRGGATNAFNLRPNSALSYQTPTYCGLSGEVGYYVEQGVRHGDMFSTGVAYKHGPVKVDAAFEVHNTNALSLTGAKREKGIRLAGTYTAGKVTVMGMCEKLRNVAGASGADRNTIGGGVAVDVGCCILKGHVFKTDGIQGMRKSGTTLFAIGADKKLAKNTTLYICYARADNEANATVPLTGGAHGKYAQTILAGNDPDGIAVGLVHNFP